VQRLLILIVLLLAAPALAQETTRDTVAETTALVMPVQPLTAAIVGLVLPVQDMIKVTATPKEVKIELPADVLFDFDKSDIRPDAAVALAAAADLLRRGVVGAIKIDGHTDSKGTAAYNQKLSQDRARSVQGWFVKNGSLPSSLRFTLTGYGATRPKVPNAKPDGSDDPDGRQTNRRVEITFTPK
jgi:outer membrane protein OmpA-like peptidoglycan-associated protein